MIVTMLFLTTGLTVIIDLMALTIMWIKNVEILKNIEKHLTDEQDEKEIKEVMKKVMEDEVEVL